MKDTTGKKIQPVDRVTEKKVLGWGEYDPDTRQRRYPLHAAQWDVLRADARYVFASAGSGGGKTALLPLWLAARIAENPTGRFLLIVPTYPMFEQVGLYSAIRQCFEGTPLEGTYNVQQHKYTLGTGGCLFIRSADDPDRIEGGQWDAIAIDEAAKLQPRAWTNIKSRSPRFFIVSTPDNNSWTYYELFKRCDVCLTPDAEYRSSDGNYYVRIWATTDNPYKANEDLDLMRQTMGKGEFERRFLGRFAPLDGLVYETFADAIFPNDGRIPDELPSPVVKVACGLDWGWHDPLCCLVGAECQDGRVYLVEELYGSKIPLDDLVAKLKAIRDRWAIDADDYEMIDGGRFDGFYCDHSRPELIALLRKHGLKARTKKVPLIETGVSLVDARLRTGFLKVYDTCGHLIDEASHYQRRADRDGQYGEKPVGKRDHAVDALRYLVTGLDFGRALNFAAAVRERDADEVLVAKTAKLKRLGLTSSEGGSAAAALELEERARATRWAELVDGDELWTPC